ncbi:MAG: hypothetical protein CBC12_12970 [Candidatus Puniceispirillum sp. TMED52]|nr:hypothetical protein [SAR116 cluster bacterium]OUU44982.1 MAG: hypothetical protein CBC12_12970 [Candidatus Puniceispirillum sp. TMED52]HCP17667.1 hypothetical protein [Alphaproteobacteria bacterium]|tara:strand:- start:1242 stop:1685 length:444 start_codon:yes stop_codon:yes gene_type:complete
MMRFFEKLVAVKVEEDHASDENLRLAATALLFRAHMVDGDADPSELAMIRRIVEDEFGLTADEVEQLLADAKASADDAADLYGWIRLVNSNYSHDEKCFLMEKLWQVILADGVIEDHEASLMRRISGLIYITDKDSAEARSQALLNI